MHQFLSKLFKAKRKAEPSLRRCVKRREQEKWGQRGSERHEE